MIHAQLTKKESVILPQAQAAAATASGQVDTMGFDYAEITIHMDSAAAVSNVPTEISVSEGDSSTAYTAISGLTGTAGFTIPTAVSNTAANIFCIGVNLLPRKRWLRLEFSSGGNLASTLTAADCQLSRDKLSLATAAERNVALAFYG